MIYRYTECGLDNVTIDGMDIVLDDRCEESYSIPNVLGLHKAIACCIVRHPSGISPKELRFLRTEMGMTRSELAQFVKKDQQTIGRWERGENSIDENAEFVIRVLTMELLEIDPGMTNAEIVKRCLPSANFEQIQIDGSDPDNYRPIAA